MPLVRLRRLLAAFLLLLPARLFSQYESVVSEVSRPNYTHYLSEVLYTRSGNSRGPASADHDAARNRIRDTLAGFGLEVALEPFEYQGGTYYNVTAVLPGKTRPGDYHVIGAHYDSANNAGADDDASGIAALLEAARVASMHEFEASLVFVAFDREEAGLIGSRAWVAAHFRQHLLSMLQMDMIAYNPQGATHNLLALCVANNSPNSTYAVIQAAIAQYGGTITPVYGGIVTGSDHASFATLTPSVQIIEASYHQNTNYHKAADTVDTPGYIDYQFATAAARSVVGYLAQQAGLLPFDPLTPRLTPAGIYNSASFIAGDVAPAEFITLTGSGFGAKSSAAVRDSSGSEQPAQVVFSSARQINLLLPAALAGGSATLLLTREDGVQFSAPVNVQPVAPGVFAADSSGSGPPAAQAVRVASDGSQLVQDLFECTTGTAECFPVPVDFGAEGDRVILVLYGTGIRGRSRLANVQLEIEGEKLPAGFAAAQPAFPGLDQVNVELPRALRGRGRVSVTLRVDGNAANPVAMDFGAP